MLYKSAKVFDWLYDFDAGMFRIRFSFGTGWSAASIHLVVNDMACTDSSLVDVNIDENVDGNGWTGYSR